MESRDLIEDLRRQLSQVEAQGGTQVQVAALRSYLEAVEKNAAVSLEHRKLEHEGMLAHYAAQSEFNIEMLRSVLESAKSGIQALLVINGGAVIALLGVMSNLATRPGGDLLARYLALPLLEFGAGVLCAGLAFAFRYFSQACYSEGGGEKNKYTTWGDRLRIVTILIGVAGYVLFGVAMVNAYQGVVWSFAS
jgi:hypothetical protein